MFDGEKARLHFLDGESCILKHSFKNAVKCSSRRLENLDKRFAILKNCDMCHADKRDERGGAERDGARRSVVSD